MLSGELGLKLVHAQELRQEQRQGVTLRVRLLLPGGELDTYTDNVSRNGFRVRLPTIPPMGQPVQCAIQLPDGSTVLGTAVCRNVQPGNFAGFSLEIEEQSRLVWGRFIDQEETTGSLWRLLSRYVQSSSESETPLHMVIARGPFGKLVRPAGYGAGALGERSGVPANRSVALSLHTVGDSGEAYRVAFEKNPSDPPHQSALAERLPGFAEMVQGSVQRVLRENLLIRLHESTPIFPARVCELARGGFAYLQRGEGESCGLAGLCVGELLLVAVDGFTLYPHLDRQDLARIALDSISGEIRLPAPRTTVAEAVHPEVRAQARTSSQLQSVPGGGIEAVRFAQVRSGQAQTRRYGERELHLFPEVWVEVVTTAGSTFSGPTMEDPPHTCVLALQGPGAPKVVRLSEEFKVRLIADPRLGAAG